MYHTTRSYVCSGLINHIQQAMSNDDINGTSNIPAVTQLEESPSIAESPSSRALFPVASPGRHFTAFEESQSSIPLFSVASPGCHFTNNVANPSSDSRTLLLEVDTQSSNCIAENSSVLRTVPVQEVRTGTLQEDLSDTLPAHQDSSGVQYNPDPSGSDKDNNGGDSDSSSESGSSSSSSSSSTSSTSSSSTSSSSPEDISSTKKDKPSETFSESTAPPLQRGGQKLGVGQIPTQQFKINYL